LRNASSRVGWRDPKRKWLVNRKKGLQIHSGHPLSETDFSKAIRKIVASKRQDPSLLMFQMDEAMVSDN